MAFAARASTQVHPLGIDQEEEVPPAAWVAGNLAVATRRYRARHTSVGAHIPGAQVQHLHSEPAVKRPMSLRRLRAVHTPAEPQAVPTTATRRAKFTMVATPRFSWIDRHAPDDPVLFDALGGKHEIPHPPTEPKPEKGLRPSLRTPAA